MRVLLIGSLPYAQRSISDFGCEAHLITTKSEIRYGLETIQDAYVSVTLPKWDVDLATSYACALHNLTPYDGVLSFEDDGLLISAKIARDLNILGNELMPVSRTVNKHSLREALKSLPELNVPYQLCKSIEDVEAFFERYPTGIVIKPVSGQGSRGVVYIGDSNEIPSLFNYTAHFSSGYVLAEQYCHGLDFSIETFSHGSQHEILAITDKQNTGIPHFVGTLHSMPSMTDLDVQKRVSEAVRQALDCIGLSFGPAHTEVSVIDGVVKIIEIQLRPGGRFYHMLEGAFGIDIFRLTVSRMLNKKYQQSTGQGAAAICYLKAEPGVIQEIEGVEAVKSDPRVRHLHIRHKVGDRTREWENSLDRSGHVICVAESPIVARDTALELASKIKFRTS